MKTFFAAPPRRRRAPCVESEAGGGFHVRGPLPFQLRPRRHRLLGPHPPRRRRTLVRRRLGQATHFLFPRHLRPLPPCRLRLRPRRTPARRPRLGHTPAHPPM